MTFSTRVFFVFFFLFLHTNFSIAQTLEAPKIDELVQQLLKKHKVVGASISILDSNGIIFSKGYGFADKENKIPVQAETIFPFGSVSKVITMAGVLKLQDLGYLNIDSSYTKYVHDYSSKSHINAIKPFSIFDLIAQQAGIPRTRLKDLYTDSAKPTDFYNLIEEEKNNYLIEAPGVVYQYSDIGISMLGLLPKYTANVDYTQFIKNQLFIQIGMNHASFHRDSVNYFYTKGYENGKEAKIFATRYLPAFGLQASSEDMAKFAYLFLNNGKSIDGKQIISSDLVKRSINRQNQNTRIAYSNHLGFTWWLGDFYGFKSVYHGGEQKPCLSTVRILPQLKIGIVVVMNSDMNGQFLSEVTEQILLEVLKSKQIKFNQNYYDKNKVYKYGSNLSKELKDLYIGDYASSYGIISIKPKNENNFRVNLLAANKKFKGSFVSDSTMQLNYMLLGLIPVKVMRLFVDSVDNRVIIGTKAARNGRKIFGGQKINFEMKETEWNSISGTYYICNLNDKEYPLMDKISISDYKGIKVISGTSKIPDVEKFQFCIQPINNNLALVQGIGGQGLLGETIKRWENDKEEFIEIAGYVFKKTVN
jgi:CubicO group peptidase (beta-lactamase class C family)